MAAPGLMVAMGPALLPVGLRNTFVDLYTSLTAESSKNLKMVMDLDLPSNAVRETYAYPETAPHPRREDRHNPIHEDAMRFVQFSVVNDAWSVAIPYHRDDEADDQTEALGPAIASTASHFALLPERNFFEIVSGTVDPELLPALPLAPDGAALFSTTDGAGNARFGATSGNSLSGTGITSTAAVQTDFYTAVEQFIAFQDTKGQPLIPQELVAKGMIVVFPSSLLQVFQQAFLQRAVSVVHGSNTAASTPTNVVLDSGHNVTLWPTPRLTGHNWLLGLTAIPHRAIFSQLREALYDFVATEQNSDNARDFLIRKWYWRERKGYGVNLPFGLIQVTNG